MQLVDIISFLDRYIHELVRVGMLDIFLGKRPPTRQFNTFNISSKSLLELSKYDVKVPLEEIEIYKILNDEIVVKNGFLAFQHPNKISDALSYVWPTTHKWQLIAQQMGGGYTSDKVTDQLILLVERRNKIVHEGDMDGVNKCKIDIEKSYVDDSIAFVKKMVDALNYLVPNNI